MGSILGWEEPLEKEMAIRSSILAWKIPWIEEPDRLQSMGLQKVGHDCVTFTSLYTVQWASQVVLVVKIPPANEGDIRDSGSIPGSRRSPGGEHGN